MIENKYRIRWLHGHDGYDCTIMKKFVEGQIDEATAIKRLEASNRCKITREQFYANLDWLGWRKMR